MNITKLDATLEDGSVVTIFPVASVATPSQEVHVAPGETVEVIADAAAPTA